MQKEEHSAILLTFIKLPFVIKNFVLSIFEWPFSEILLYAFFFFRAFLYPDQWATFHYSFHDRPNTLNSTLARAKEQHGTRERKQLTTGLKYRERHFSVALLCEPTTIEYKMNKTSGFCGFLVVVAN